ncbi:MAG: hypothetical protein JKX67_05525, partial [Colwellia sp.]|nr:hypothetical protein [Colwellia sp.]
VIVVLAAVFWGDSRYPALDAKAIMDGSSQLEDPLSFKATIQLQADDGFVRRVLLTVYNWVNTNLQGMTFVGAKLETSLVTLISSPTLNIGYVVFVMLNANSLRVR